MDKDIKETEVTHTAIVFVDGKPVEVEVDAHGEPVKTDKKVSAPKADAAN